MKNSLGAAVVFAACALVACEKQQPPKELPAPPSIVSFTVDRSEIAPGEEATLSFEARNATRAVITDHLGAVVEPGNAEKASVVVKPTQTAFYVLRVEGDGGSATAFVQVAVGEDLRTVALVAVPPEVESGEGAQLLWTAFNAKSAVIQTSTGELITLDPTAGSGIIDVKPARTVTYQLVASGADAAVQHEAAAEVRVRPVLESFTAEPAAARPGKTIKLSWQTRGGGSVSVTEQTFGQLHAANHPAETPAVDNGSFTFTVPEQLPNGQPVIDGYPLRFVLRVVQTNPQLTLERVVTGYVGDGPRVTDFRAPAAVTGGKNFELSWRTENAVRLQVIADGGVLYEPLPKNAAEVKAGSIVVAAPAKDTQYEIRVWSHLGAQSSATRLVRVVTPPTADSFNLPMMVGSPGDAAMATWTTTNATRVIVRVKDGPTVFHSTNATDVGAGSAPLYPGSRTTFVLEAYNDANDVATREATVDVSNPGAVTASPVPTTAGDEVTVSWNLDTSVVAQIVGDPVSAPVTNNPSTTFVDLAAHVDAETLVFADADDSTSAIPLPSPFHFPLAGAMNDSFVVSTNGFLAFGGTSALPSNVALDGTGAVPAMIAPFWDDLELGADGSVLYLLDGTSFPRRLVVQWNKVQTKADPDGELTFQVQLFETGEFRFVYETLEGDDALGENASIGWRLNPSLAHELSNGGAVLTAKDEVDWFSSGMSSGQFTFKPTRSGQLTLFGRRATGGWVVFPVRLNVIAPGSVLINEAMLLPDASSSKGRWIELFNTTSEPIDLGDTVLSTQTGMTSFTIPAGTLLPANGYLVLGESVDPVENGEAQVDLEWGSLNPDASAGDTVTLSASSEIHSLVFNAAQVVPKQTLQTPEPVIDSNGMPATCPRTQTYGQVGDKGTPGAQNEACFAYRLVKIPVAYRDISTSGTALWTPGSSNQDQLWTTLDLSSAPFTYFGATHTSVGVTTNGVIAFPTIDSSYSGNKTQPDTDDPVGSVGVFWDDLDSRNAPADGNMYFARIAAGQDPSSPVGHWIIQWHHYEYWLSSPDDDLNFQVKLFDDGVIEFHYADMISTDTENKADGNTATEWLENPDGSTALVIGVEQPVIQSNTAYRFTPVK